jgi:phosphoglycolate phosphatase
MRPKPQAVLFDWDDTLIDSGKIIKIAQTKMLAHMGKEADYFETSGVDSNLSAKDSLRLLFPQSWQEALDFYRLCYKEHHLVNLSLLNGAKKVLDFLKDHSIYMSLVSNKMGDTLRQEVHHLGLNDYFTKIIGSLDLAVDKPDKAVVEAALLGSGIEACAQVLFVGDSLVDMQCAKNSGCRGVFFNHHQKQVAKELIVVNNHQELLKFMQLFLLQAS